MTNLSFDELNQCFIRNDFTKIEQDNKGLRFLKLRSISRKELLKDFCAQENIDITELKPKEYFRYIFEQKKINGTTIDNFIKHKYEDERKSRRDNQDNLIYQLNKLQHFDWGGSYGNSLEKNIINNYVKKIQCYDAIITEIEGSLLSSLKGYTLSSWYNHWTSILIEDLFKDHKSVLPAIGLIKKIDFFINNIPFDLKVTYFPEQLLADKLKQQGYGNELTNLKKICRKLEILIPNDLKPKELKLYLYNVVSEDLREDAINFIADLKKLKQDIIAEAEANPKELKKWFYENQGEARFDASNRFFLVLIDQDDMTNSWKLKRNIRFLHSQISTHLDNLSGNTQNLETVFFWKKDQQHYRCKSDILFIKK